MRDNTKSGALTKMTFYICSPIHQGMGMPCAVIENKKRKGRFFVRGRYFIRRVDLSRKKLITPMAIWKKEKKNIMTPQGKEICRKRACEAS